jgi:hypothetical protein
MTADPEQGPEYLGLPPADRYTAPLEDAEVLVELDGSPRPARVLGRNGPRVQVSVLVDGNRYRRWVDASTVLGPAAQGGDAP